MSDTDRSIVTTTTYGVKLSAETPNNRPASSRAVSSESTVPTISPEPDLCQSFAKNRAQHAVRAGADRHAHADLARALADRVTHHAEHANRGQHQCRDGEDRQQPRHRSRRRHRRVDDLLHRPHLEQREIRVDISHRRANRAGRALAPDRV